MGQVLRVAFALPAALLLATPAVALADPDMSVRCEIVTAGDVAEGQFHLDSRSARPLVYRFTAVLASADQQVTETLQGTIAPRGHVVRTVRRFAAGQVIDSCAGEDLVAVVPAAARDPLPPAPPTVAVAVAAPPQQPGGIDLFVDQFFRLGLTAGIREYSDRHGEPTGTLGLDVGAVYGITELVGIGGRAGVELYADNYGDAVIYHAAPMLRLAFDSERSVDLSLGVGFGLAGTQVYSFGLGYRAGWIRGDVEASLIVEDVVGTEAVVLFGPTFLLSEDPRAWSGPAAEAAAFLVFLWFVSQQR